MLSETLVEVAQHGSDLDVPSKDVESVLAENRARRKSSVVSRFSVKVPETFNSIAEEDISKNDDQVRTKGPFYFF